MVIVKSKFNYILFGLVLLSLLSLSVMAEDNKTIQNITLTEENLTNKNTTEISTKIVDTKEDTVTKKPKITVTQAVVKDTCLYYFYGTGCLLCAETDTFISNLENKYPELRIKKYEVYYNKSNRKLLQNYLLAYDIDRNQQGLPIIFLPTSYFIGPKSINTFLEGAVNSNTYPSCPDLSNKEVVGITSKHKSPQNLIETLTFSMVSVGAFENSFTYQALAILIVLLLIFLGIKTRRKLIGTGIAFTLAVFLAYLLIGMGIIVPIKSNCYAGIGVLAILVSLCHFKKHYWSRLKIIPDLPEKINKIWRKTIKLLINPGGAFLFGFLISLFQLTDQGMYKTLLELMADQATKTAALPLLLFHNFIFVLYLVIITLLIGYSMKRKEAKKGKLDIPDGIENKVKTNIRSLHFLINLIMFILGVILVFF